MTSLIAALALAAVLPSDFLDSVGVAAYWYKKDSRGRGDEISEQAKPRLFPAFAISNDTFILSDPEVRAKHLDKLEFWCNGRRYPAKEIARGENPDTVMIKTEKLIEGIKPLAFVKGEPVERLTWSWNGDSQTVEANGIGTNSDVKIDIATRKAFHQGRGNSLLIDRDRRPVALDFGDFSLVDGDRFVHPDAVGRCTAPADSFEQAALSIEEKYAKAAFPILIKFEQQEKEPKSRRRYPWREESQNASEADCLGFAIGGKVLVPCDIGGDGIARFKSAEATLADGTRAKLEFLGALTEWQAIVFALPADCADRVPELSVCTRAPHSMLGERAWLVAVENEGGRPVADATRNRVTDIEFLRGAKFAVSASDGLTMGEMATLRSLLGGEDRNRQRGVFRVAADGSVASMVLRRRYGDKWLGDAETIGPEDLADALAGKAFNPEFRPRTEADRNRTVWLGYESVELNDALAREKKAQSYIDRLHRPPLVTEVHAGSPCAKAGIRAGDILIAYRRGNDEECRLGSEYDGGGRDWAAFFESEYSAFYTGGIMPWSNVESDTNRELTKLGVGAKITLVYVRDGRRCEAEIVLEAAPPHYQNAAKSRNRALGTVVRDMTFEVRRFFKFDDREPGVVIAKIKPGSPAAVAGLKVYELITEVNGEKVTGAKDFAAKIRDRKDLIFAVRRLSQTRMVKIHVQQAQEKETK